MAISFANFASNLGNSDSASEGLQVQDGSELQEIQTDQIGFQAINGEAKLRLLSNAWSSGDLPIPSASLLSVASSQGLLAAAGPDALVLATTDSIRKAFREQGDNTKDADTFLEIPHSRITHIAFSSDESVLVVSEQGRGGIIAYQVDNLKRNQREPALQLETNGVGLRTLVPNPAVASAQYFAAVTINGELLLADLGASELKSGPEGTVLMRNASCLSWSNKGKQLVVGLADGTAVQMKPDGTIVTRIPKSTSVPSDVHISGITWLENDLFLIIYTPNDTSTDNGIPPSEYHIVTRDKNRYTFQKLPEVLPPFGLERVPTQHFVSRLRSWKPHLDDLVILAATTATDIGIISKADKALSNTDPVTKTFTYTTIDDDRRRAALPLSTGDSVDTTPIGMAIDLSSKERVPRPILADEEVLETDGSVPNLLVLNNEGILCSWWVIYNDSVKEKTIFSGFASLDTMAEARSAVSQAPEQSRVPVPQPSIVSSPPSSSVSSPFVKSAMTFGATSQSGFGTGSGFGTASKIGENKNSWTSTGFGSGPSQQTGSSTFGQSGFGAPTPAAAGGAPAFGSTGTLGSRPTAFGQPVPVAPAFGQTGFGVKPATNSPFGAGTSSPFSTTNADTSASGFGTFANSGGFGGFGAAKKDEINESPFAKATGSSAFGQGSSSSSPFAKASDNSIFGQPTGSSPFAKSSAFGSNVTENKSVFGTGENFKLNSTFKSDGTAKDDLPKPAPGSSFGFGSGFNDLLGETKPTLSPTRDTEAEMNDEDEGVSSTDHESPLTETSGGHSIPNAETQRNLVTPPSTISQSKANPAPPVSSLFGSGTQQAKTPENASSNVGWTFGGMTSTTPIETPAPMKTLFGTKSISSTTPARVQESEPVALFSPVRGVQTPASKPKLEASTQSHTDNEASGGKSVANDGERSKTPLLPDSTSKSGSQIGDTSSSSNGSRKLEDAPLPPDFLPANKTAVSKAETVGLPDENPDEGDEDEDEDDAEEGFSSDFEGSGEDVTQDISPAEDGGDSQHEDSDDDDDTATEQLQTSPESSFKEDQTASVASPTGGLFTKVSNYQQPKPIRPLFGEVGNAGPVFPPPKPQESPRSPSPVRQLLPHDSLRPESRSVSAPARPRSAIDQRKVEYQQSAIATQAAQAREQEAAREKARLDAAKHAQEQAKANELQSLEDHEDERIQRELSQPIEPSETLDAFITYQTGTEGQTNKADIPAQIERLYQDVNSMICTLGINARSLSSFLAYQTQQQPNSSWPDVLDSETPLDALNDEWFLQDIEKLHQGCQVIEQGITQASLATTKQKLDQQQGLLTQELSDFKVKVISLRKSLNARIHSASAEAPLSAEQASVQHDLRKASASVQTKLINVEGSLAMLRARLSDMPSQSDSGLSRRDGAQSYTSSRRPTVEAVTNTVAKMTMMAEKKSADVDVLESKLKKLGLASEPSTPPRLRGSYMASTPGSATGSIYHTPDSKIGAGRATPRSNGTSRKLNGTAIVSTEDKERWQGRRKRKQDVASVLKNVLEQKRGREVGSV